VCDNTNFHLLDIRLTIIILLCVVKCVFIIIFMCIQSIHLESIVKINITNGINISICKYAIIGGDDHVISDKHI